MQAVLQREKAAEKVSLWLDSLHSIKTRRFYLYFLSYVLGEAKEPRKFSYLFEKKELDISSLAEFVAGAWADPDSTGTFLLKWITSKTKEKQLKASAVRTYFAPVNSVLKFCNCKVELYPILKALPQKARTTDTAPSKEELRILYNRCDPRGKFILSAMSSGGFRVGAWDYLRWNDLKDLGDIGQLTVYANEPEQYITFLSSEAMNDFRTYLEYRKKAGEDFSDKKVHPILRAAYNLGNPTAGIIRKATSHSIEDFFDHSWRLTGIERSFSRCHGLRKYFKGQLEGTEMKSNLIEKLMGHRVFMEETYHKITPEKLAEIYRLYQSVLWINEVPELEAKLASQEKKFEAEENHWYIQSKRAEDRAARAEEYAKLSFEFTQAVLSGDTKRQHDLAERMKGLD